MSLHLEMTETHHEILCSYCFTAPCSIHLPFAILRAPSTTQLRLSEVEYQDTSFRCINLEEFHQDTSLDLAGLEEAGLASSFMAHTGYMHALTQCGDR